MCPGPVDAAALGALRVARLRAAHVGWHPFGDHSRHPRLQLGVALYAPGEGFIELERELGENLAQLVGDVVVADQDRAHHTGLDRASLGQVAIAREQHPALGGRFADELSVADASVVRRVVSKRAQPARQPPDVAVGEESRLHRSNLRIGCVAAPDDLMARLRGEATGCYSWSNGPGDRYPAHSHSYEKVLYCVAGSIMFLLDAEERKRIELYAGDRMVLPAGTVHSAVVGPAGCTCIEGKR